MRISGNQLWFITRWILVFIYILCCLNNQNPFASLNFSYKKKWIEWNRSSISLNLILNLSYLKSRGMPQPHTTMSNVPSTYERIETETETIIVFTKEFVRFSKQSRWVVWKLYKYFRYNCSKFLYCHWLRLFQGKKMTDILTILFEEPHFFSWSRSEASWTIHILLRGLKIISFRSRTRDIYPSRYKSKAEFFFSKELWVDW